MRENHIVADRAAAASAQEITRGRADLLESTIALALSRKQTEEERVDLVSSELVNNSLSLANAMLVASEATLERLVEERTAALTREIEEREGTAIFLHLPRPKPNAFTPVKVVEGTVINDQTLRAVERTILVVEDDSDLADFTVCMLEGQGYAARQVSNAMDALEQLESGLHVDAVFSDVVMPGPMNGIQLAEHLKRQFPHLAVVLATGYSQILAEGEQPVMAEVLNKPYRRLEFDAALKRAFAALRH